MINNGNWKIKFDKNIINNNLESIPIRPTLLNTKIDGIYWVLLKHQRKNKLYL